ncbi:alginate export family protein [Phenylobacterium sp.]|uniref:alginate export family protein n=1 Tax=Phenylobacterium sp. TaxID=1871053 RepID=UPI002731E2D3|nr:alginate export family protein [Phenylobacterium sp.]MDP1618761.1 alginate export family protein [Phenylobacterium sp.]MDP1986935.1 alginate export family protein [Phenylobacterium sp.]
MTLKTSRAIGASLIVLASAIAASPAAAQAAPWTLHEAIGAPDNLKLSGTVRARYETLEGQYRPAYGDGSDQGLVLRSNLFAELDLAPIRIGGEIIDARVYLNDSGSPTGTGDVNALELIQAYVALDANDLFLTGSEASVTAGRFTMDLGSRRLVGRSSYGNATNAFAGLRADWSADAAGDVTLFYTYPLQKLPSDRAGILDNEIEADRQNDDLIFWGGIYTTPKFAGGSKLETFVFRLEEEDSPRLATRNRRLTTVGGRFFRNPAAGKWDYEMEGGWQTGEARNSTSAADRRDLDVDAQYLHLEVGKTFAAAWSPRVSFEYDFASGDKSSTDGEYNRFDGLFGPRRPDFGPPGAYGPLGRSNLNSPGVRLEVAPNKRWDAMAFYRALYLDEATDSFASTGVRDATGRSGDFAGHQLEARARYWIVPKATRLEFGVAKLFNGEFLEDAPNATGAETLFGYVELSQTF